MESIGNAMGVVSGHVQGDLERFKTFIESRGNETGGWRGSIRGRKTSNNASAASQEQPRSARMNNQSS
jgi:hypothetical protein